MPDTRTEIKHGKEIAKELQQVGEMLATLYPEGQYATLIVRLGSGLPDAVIPFEIQKGSLTPPHSPCS